MSLLVQAQNTNFGIGSGTAGAGNSNFGSYTGESNQGVSNTFLGAWSGRYSVGNYNLFGGSNAGLNSGVGDYNVFLGSNTGKNADGQSNVFIGYAAGFQNSSNRNLFVGMDAGYNSINGAHNIFLGYRSGYLATGSNNIFLGYQAGYNETGSSLLYIDNSSTSTPLIWGDFSNNLVNINGKLGIGTNNPTSELHVAGDILSTGNITAENGNSQDWNTAFSWGNHSNAGYFISGSGASLSAADIFISDGRINSNGNLYLQNSGATAITVLNSNRNVGIGTATPSQKLHVNGNLLTTGWLNIQNDNGLKNVGDNNHFFSNSDSYWKMQSRNGLEIANNDGSRKAVLYHSGTSFGFLDATESWALQMVQDEYTAFRIDNDEKMRILSDGRVGIGTSNPAADLQVIGDIAATGSLNIQNDNGLKNVGDNNQFFSISGDYWQMQSGNGLVIANNDGNRKALLYHSGNSFGFLDSSDNWALEINKNNYTSFRIANDEKMRILANGHVGIGTPSPGAKLEVNGDTKITGNLHLDGDLVYGQGINNDPQAPKLLALDASDKMVFHHLNDVRNPWGLRFVQDALGTGLNCMEFEDLNTDLILEVDVLDIHGNLLLGNNGYIDDRDI